MNKKSLYMSIGAAVLLILASLTSVIGFTTTQSQHEQQSVSSPLFSIRTSRSIGQASDQSMKTTFLGKGRMTSLFLSEVSSTDRLIERGLQLVRTSPALVEKTLRKTLQDPQMQRALRDHGINQQMVLQYFHKVKYTPEVLANQIENSVKALPPYGGAQPLGLLNTSNALACVITIIALLPVILVIGILIATITLVTCLNINNCFDNLINNLLQGLQAS